MNSTLKTVLIIFILAVMSMSIWLYEILEIKGWYSLNWVREPLFSPYVSALIVVLAFLTPFFIQKKLTIKQAILPVCLLYGVNVLCFFAGKSILYQSAPSHLGIPATESLVLMLILGVLLHFILGLAYWLITNQWILKIKKINILYISLLALLMLPLGELSAMFYSYSGNIEGIKMGYPIFWISIAMGFAGMMVLRQKGN